MKKQIKAFILTFSFLVGQSSVCSAGAGVDANQQPVAAVSVSNLQKKQQMLIGLAQDFANRLQEVAVKENDKKKRKQKIKAEKKKIYAEIRCVTPDLFTNDAADIAGMLDTIPVNALGEPEIELTEVEAFTLVKILDLGLFYVKDVAAKKKKEISRKKALKFVTKQFKIGLITAKEFERIVKELNLEAPSLVAAKKMNTWRKYLLGASAACGLVLLRHTIAKIPAFAKSIIKADAPASAKMDAFLEIAKPICLELATILGSLTPFLAGA